MPVFDTYSRRKRRTEQKSADVYQYDQAPQKLRVQVALVIESALGSYSSGGTSFSGHNDGWRWVWNTARRELGRRCLVHPSNNPRVDFIEAVQSYTKIDDWLDLVEIAFRLIFEMKDIRIGHLKEEYGITQPPEDALDELNVRFRDAGLGFQFEQGRIIRIDSTFLHAEAVKTALCLVSDPRFAGAQEEFLSAHKHYRSGEHEDAIVDALRAFESTMKVICELRGQAKPGARASDLLKMIRALGLLPSYLDQSFDQLAATLQSGLPKVRNEAGGHGQGGSPRITPAYIAGYALHLTAADTVLLIEAFKASERT